ncbi:hypothetical protein PLESTB_000314200 [Pleodorina starrii]|uniref:Uncharacterized protein n=1 Tax=Pleodorina starrii TaxID=330485 RepID=A0A9W6BDZ2_9CHLO|nr:hypothetical protein PLESTB_000314200 [Pleodorina starrii]GLC77022.1 hypothetical protein PLESTF_001874800 [Pleodorina starrii]
MGGSCSHAADAWANLATKEELREAVKSIEAWQKLQDQSRAAGHAAGNRNSSKGPLLQRVGGLDVVKQVVEGFYRRLYSDKRLLTFLHDKDMTYLRAKQTLFMSWLFGPPNQPYTGRNVRIAHLKLIKQRGFSPEDFDLGMEYFEQAMRELEAPETIISEVMCKVRPFKTVIFTPCERDADEEARWAFEERVKEQQSAAKEKEKERQQSLKEKQQSMSPSKADADAAAALAGQSSRALATGASGALAGAGSGSSRGPQCPFTGGGGGGSSSSNRGPQCPFTSGRLSSPASVTGIRVSGEILTPAPPAPPPPPAAVTSANNNNGDNGNMLTSPSRSQSRPATETVSSPANTCTDGTEAPAAPAAGGGGGDDVPAAVAAAAAAAYASSNGCDDLKALARELQPQASKAGSRRSFDTPQPQTPEAGSRPGLSAAAAAAAAPPQRQLASSSFSGSRPASAAATPQSRTPEAGTRSAAAAAAAAQPPNAEIRPASAAPQLLPSSSGLSPAATGRTEQLRSTKSGSRPAAAAAAPPPPQPQSLSRSPAAQAQSSTQAAKAGSRPPSAIPQPPPKKPAGSRPASAVPTPPPAALQRQASRAGAASRPASGSPPAPSPDGPFSVARDLADLARSASQAGGGGGAAAAAAAAGTLPPAVSGGSLRRLTTGPCAESAEVDRFWEAEITAAAAAAADAQGGRPGAAAGAAANGLPQARVSSRSLGATEASAAAAAGGGGAKPERPALLALEMAVEMGLAEPEEGEDGGAAGDAAAAAAAVAAAGGSGGVEIVDAFLTEMLEKEAQGKTAA